MSHYQNTYRRSLDQREAYWAEQAAQLHWDQPWERVLDESRPPFYRWFPGGRLNTCLLYTSPSPRD